MDNETKLICKKCSNDSFYRTGSQLYSYPPWDIFGCNKCYSLYGINCGYIYKFENDQVIYRADAIVRNEGKPYQFTTKDGRLVLLNYPPGTDERLDYDEYRKPNKHSGPAVAVYKAKFDTINEEK